VSEESKRRKTKFEKGKKRFRKKTRTEVSFLKKQLPIVEKLLHDRFGGFLFNCEQQLHLIT
jgi:hypothetical protein